MITHWIIWYFCLVVKKNIIQENKFSVNIFKVILNSMSLSSIRYSQKYTNGPSKKKMKFLFLVLCVFLIKVAFKMTYNLMTRSMVMFSYLYRNYRFIFRLSDMLMSDRYQKSVESARLDGTYRWKHRTISWFIQVNWRHQ